MITALYIDPRGPYPGLLGGEACWDAARDARLYEGPGPVVAHPPCGPWGELRHMYQGAEHDCAPRAVEQVRAFGGVLEHPSRSKLWSAIPLPLPTVDHANPPGVMIDSSPDAYGGFTIQVDQVEWGHVARKRTWVYIVGVEWIDVARAFAARPFPGKAPTHWCSGSRAHPGRKGGGVVPPGIKVCSAEQRRRTPPAFAEFLISLARAAKPASSP